MKRIRLSFKITFTDGGMQPVVKTAFDSTLPKAVADWQMDVYRILKEMPLPHPQDTGRMTKNTIKPKVRKIS